MDDYVQSNLQDNQKFNILAVMDGVDGMTPKGIVDGLKFDAKRWKQFNKFAVISDKKWIGALTELGSYLPGIKAKYFEKNEVEEAWEWVIQ